MAHVNIVTSDRGWILENLATQISSRLPYVTFGEGVDPDATIQYYVTYSCRYRRVSPIEVGYFAHLEPEGEAYEKFFRVAEEVDFCISHAQLYASMLRQRGIENVTAISPGVDLDRFTPKLRVGVVGRTYHTGRKGEHLAAQVMDIPEIEWMFTGEGWPDPALKLPDSELPDFYRKLDYVLVPALYEGGPMCVVEALASGTEVIAPEIGWVPEFPHVEYQVGDVADLRSVLLELVEKKRALRTTVLDRTWDAWAEGHDRVFQSLARKHGVVLSPPSVAPSKPNPRKIGLFLHGDEGKSPGGPSVRVPRLAQELRELGADASVVRYPSVDFSKYDIAHAFNVWAPRSALDLLRHAKAAGTNTIFSPIYLDLSMRKLWQDDLPRIFAESDGEVELTRKLEKFRVECDRQRASTEAPPEPVPGYYAAVREMMSLSDAAIFLSERERRRLDIIGADTSRGTVVHNPVDWELFSQGDPALFEAEYGLRDFVLCVARRESRKNQLMLMRALRDTNIPLVLVGHAASSSYVELMERYQTSNVHIIERLPPNSPLLAAAFAASRVSVLPSWAEGAPLAALEAGAAGASLVLSDESGESEYFGSYARYCDPASVEDMRRTILEAYESKRSAESIEEQKKFISGTFNWDRHREATRAVYRSVFDASAREDVLKASAAPTPPRMEKPIHIVYDVTTSANHKGRWTGIARVEAALGIAFKQNPRVSSITYVSWNNKAQTFIEIPFEAIRTGKTSNILSYYDNAPVRPLDLPAGAFYVMGGSGWMQNSQYAEGLVAFKYKYNLILSPIIHDVIPIRFPFWFNDGYAPIFSNNLNILLGNSDLVVAISECTKNDIEFFAHKTIDCFIPQICTFREGDEISQIATRVTDLPASVEALDGRPFILTVGAIHLRKNHKLLYDVWVKLCERMGGRCPVLVVVGGVAWNGGDLARAMQGDARVKDRIVVLEHIDDHALEWLYRNCLFTVYPSLYEGWGLPVSESLRYGKLCLASDASSVPEIAPDFVELIDPLDPAKWLAKIQFYATSRAARAWREERIARNYRSFTWKESSDALLDAFVEHQDIVPLSRNYTSGTVLNMGNRLDAARHKRGGWYLTEKWGAWSSGLRPRLSLHVFEPYHTDVIFIAEVKGFAFPGAMHEVRVLANGEYICRWSFEGGEPVVRQATIPLAFIKNATTIDIELENASLTPISRVSKSTDTRSVGVGIGRYALVAAPLVANAAQYLGATLKDARRVEANRTYDFLKQVSNRDCLVGDWKVNSAWGAYNTDTRARIALVVQEAPASDLEVELLIRPVASEWEPLTLILLVNEQQATSWTFTSDALQRVKFPLSRKAREIAEPITVDLVPSDVRAPKDIQVGESETAFGFGLFAMRITAPEIHIDHDALPYEMGQTLTFSTRPDVPIGQVSEIAGAWYGVEANGVWAAGPSGRLTLRVPRPALPDVMLRAEMRPFARQGEATSVELRVNGTVVGQQLLDGARFTHVEVAFPSALIGDDELLHLEMNIPEASSPYKCGDGSDERLLGIRLGTLALQSFPQFRFGSVVRFAASMPQEWPDAILREGWFKAENLGRWCRAVGRLGFRIAAECRSSKLFVIARCFGARSDEPVFVDIFVNDILVDTWRFWNDAGTLMEVRGFSSALGEVGENSIVFRRRDPKSPRELGIAEDSRLLGLMLAAMALLEPENGIPDAAELFQETGVPFKGTMNGTRPLAASADVAELKLLTDLLADQAALEADGGIAHRIGRGAPASKMLAGNWFEQEEHGIWSHSYGAHIRLRREIGWTHIDRVLLRGRLFGTTVDGEGLISVQVASGKKFFFCGTHDNLAEMAIPLSAEDFAEDDTATLTLTRYGALSPFQVARADGDQRLLGWWLGAVIVFGVHAEQATNSDKASTVEENLRATAVP